MQSLQKDSKIELIFQTDSIRKDLSKRKRLTGKGYERMVTIKDIAKAANVSAMTVSNVLHGRTKKVSKETRERIERLMEEMKYVPNMGARMLVQNHSRIIGVIANAISDEGGETLYGPLVMEMLGEIEKEVKDHGYYMMFSASSSEKEICDMIRTWNVDGILTIGLPTEVCRHLGEEVRMPAVFTDCYFGEEEQYLNVGTEDEEGSYIAAEYLIQKGHRKIAYVTDGPYDENGNPTGVSLWKLKGFQRAVKEAYLPFAKEHVYRGSTKEEEQRKMLQSLASHIFDYTAVVFCRDYYAIEAMDYFRHHGIWIPKDISVVGFDDISMAKMAYPRLTTVRQGVREKGRKAAELLFQALEDKELKKADIRMPVKLVERETVKEIY